MSFLLKNLLKNSFQNVKNVELMHLKKMLKKMVLKKMLIKFLDDNLLILALQKKCKLKKIIDDIEAPGPLTRSRASHLSNFCGHFAFVSITEPTKVDEAFLEPEWI